MSISNNNVPEQNRLVQNDQQDGLANGQENENSPKPKSAYAELHRAVEVTVPDDWDEDTDREYFQQEVPPKMRPDELADDVSHHLRICRLHLTRAFRFLTKRTDDIFEYLPLQTQVEILRTLFRKRSQDEGYLDRFDTDLQRFLDLDRIGTPICVRYLLAPESVWLRELVDLRLQVYDAYLVFEESMQCEHDYCPDFDFNSRNEESPKTLSVAKVLEDLHGLLQKVADAPDVVESERTKLLSVVEAICKTIGE